MSILEKHIHTHTHTHTHTYILARVCAHAQPALSCPCCPIVQRDAVQGAPLCAVSVCVSRYFDRTGCGYVKADDLKRMLHNLGLGLPNRLVKHTVYSVIDRRDDRLEYRYVRTHTPTRTHTRTHAAQACHQACRW